MTLPRIDRRTFTLGGLGTWLAGCGEEEEPGPRVRAPATQRVAVVGAGIAGLHCALCLRQANVEVQVYEAQRRVGGRLLTARESDFGSTFGSRTDPVCELGAEFVGTFDAAMRTLAVHLGIVLEDTTVVPPQFTGRRYLVGGIEVPENDLITEYADAIGVIVSALQGNDQDLERVDNTSLARWLADNLREFPRVQALLASSFRSELGLDPDRLSAINLLSLAGDASDGRFHFFKRREARFRAGRGMSGEIGPGMDQFATRMQASFPDRIHLDSRLYRILPRGDGYVLQFQRANGTGFETEADHVVLAIPFSVLRDVDLSALPLSAEKRASIAGLSYGTAAKFAGVFSTRPWRERASIGAVLDEQRLVWDGSLRLPTMSQGVLATVIGGRAGLASGAAEADLVFERLLPDLEKLFPGISLQYQSGSAVRVNWPAQPFSRGNASCYAPGQWARRGIEARSEGALHFCGEHCSLDFQGRLEGAAETGALVAGEILSELDRVPSSYHAELLALKRTVAQPYAGGEPGEVLAPLARVTHVTERHGEYVTRLQPPG